MTGPVLRVHRDLLIWLERILLAAGVALAAWCIAVLVEAHFTNTLPPPPVKVTMQVADEGERGRLESGSSTTESRHVAPPTGTMIGKLEAPTLHITTTVLEGSDDATLRRASGHIEDTPLPGDVGNVGIAGHRDTVFRPLKRAKAGDPLVLTTVDRVFRYQITRTFIVDPDDVYVLDPTPKATLTLVTCYPFEYVGHAPRRFIVKADLVREERREK
jgi:sortase A